MVWIINTLLSIIAYLWYFCVILYAREELNSPFLVWFTKCWNAKNESGGIVWNEFAAIMKYFSYCFIHRHDIADSPEAYSSLVDMGLFIYPNNYTEDDWDELAYQIYNTDGRPRVKRKKTSTKKRTTSNRKKKEKNIEESLSDSEAKPKPRKKRQPKVNKESNEIE